SETAHYPGLIDQLRAEKFDAAISEDPSGFGIFHMVGVERTALAISFTNYECTNAITQVPSAPSYVPSLFSPYGDRMSFWQRLLNTLFSFAFGFMMTSRVDLLHPIFEEDLWKSIENSSLVLLNSEPLLDYPRPTIHRVIEIGGIVTSAGNEPLDEMILALLLS
ncbi:hypothetical protein PMAYCL1PPCAC_16061, partial [Pristionchus mayeri]